MHDRNVVMAFRMQRELRRGNAFIALGALHLYGMQGVLGRLEADGYRAARVL
ncbi:MAG TPA: TraB/GumN family protein [Burkholderiales bacterium]|nr:TraB/GumN family protein [Burkholderiales bacterium]